MTRVFQTDGRLQLKSFRFFSYGSALILPGLTLLLVTINIGPGVDSDKDLTMMLFIISLFSLWLAPALYLHITYLFENLQVKLTIDGDKIRIRDRKREFTYKRDQIKITELNVGIYWKNKIDSVGRWSMVWSNYGYFKLVFDDDKEFYFTSLMLDVNNGLPISATTTRYRFLPYIDKSQPDYEQIRAFNEQLMKDNIAKYEARFTNLSKEALLHKVNNPTKFEPEAVVAAKNILEQRG
jgi:hypothetical protein